MKSRHISLASTLRPHRELKFEENRRRAAPLVSEQSAKPEQRARQRVSKIWNSIGCVARALGSAMF
jgi:hypothetical protein